MITDFAKISEKEAEKLLDVPVKFTDIPTIVASVEDILTKLNETKNPVPDDRPLRCIYSMINRLDLDVGVEILARGLGFMDIWDVRHSAVCTLYFLSTMKKPNENKPYALLTMVAAPHIIKVALMPMRNVKEESLVKDLTWRIKSSCLVDFAFVESTEDAANAEILANMPSSLGVN